MQFVIRSKLRNELEDNLKKNDIPTIIHYPIPPHLQTAYKNLNFVKGSFPIAEKMAEQVLSLPMGIHLNNETLEQTIFSTGLN